MTQWLTLTQWLIAFDSVTAFDSLTDFETDFVSVTDFNSMIDLLTLTHWLTTFSNWLTLADFDWQRLTDFDQLTDRFVKCVVCRYVKRCVWSWGVRQCSGVVRFHRSSSGVWWPWWPGEHRWMERGEAWFCGRSGNRTTAGEERKDGVVFRRTETETIQLGKEEKEFAQNRSWSVPSSLIYLHIICVCVRRTCVLVYVYIYAGVLNFFMETMKFKQFFSYVSKLESP